MTSSAGETLDHRVLIVGSGFAGIGMAVRLKAAGIEDFVILEKDSDLGGTWRDNTYPGCACDVPSYLYSFSWQQNPHWSRLFAPQAEIWDYLRQIARTHDLERHLVYDAHVVGSAFDETTGRWRVETADGRTRTSSYLVMGVGALHEPRVPDIAGLDSFAGPSFHSAQWNHSVDVRGQRVAVIGTGASAVQLVPALVPDVAALSLFQRSAPWISPKPDRPVPAWETAIYDRMPGAQRVVRTGIYWWMEARAVGFAVHPRLMKGIELWARRHLRRQVADPQLRAKLTPDYQIGCKRILLSNDYYPALTQSHVDVVTDPIREITPTGVVTADGAEHPADVLVLGTGFDVSGNLTHLKVVGRDGAELNDVWRREGMGAHLGITVSGFPNLFLLVGPNTGLGHSSMIFMIERQVDYALQAIAEVERRGADFLDVLHDVQAQFVDRVQTKLSDTVWQSGCSSWYLDESGRNFTVWPDFTWQYWRRTRRLDSGEYAFGRARAPEPVRQPAAM